MMLTVSWCFSAQFSDAILLDGLDGVGRLVAWWCPVYVHFHLFHFAFPFLRSAWMLCECWISAVQTIIFVASLLPSTSTSHSFFQFNLTCNHILSLCARERYANDDHDHNYYYHRSDWIPLGWRQGFIGSIYFLTEVILQSKKCLRDWWHAEHTEVFGII